MTGFNARSETLLAAGARMSQIEADIRNDFGPLRADVESLFSGGWTGGAARGFSQGWEQWLGGLEDCMLALNEMGRLLGVSGDDYGNAESTSLQTVINAGTGL